MASWILVVLSLYEPEIINIKTYTHKVKVLIMKTVGQGAGFPGEIKKQVGL